MVLNKKELIKIIKDIKKHVNLIDDLEKENHDCSFSSVRFQYKAKLEVLNQILEKYYSKKIITRKQRLIKTIKMCSFKIAILNKRHNRLLKNYNFSNMNKDIDLKDKIKFLNKVLDDYKQEYIKKYSKL